MKLVSFLLVLLGISMAGCSSFTPTQATPAATKPLPEATETWAPTIPSTPTRTVPSPTPTLSPAEMASSIFSELSVDVQRIPSPDGMCTWERLMATPLKDSARRKYANQFYVRVTLSCYRDGETEWVVLDEWNEQALGYPLPQLLGWSVDGNRVYYYDQVIPDGCQPLGGFQEHLRQASLTTGEVHPIGLNWTGGMTLSSDSTRLVYYDRQKGEVGIFSLATGEEQRIPFELPEPLENWYAGNFTWSPDGQSVLFIVQENDLRCGAARAFILKVDLQTGTVSSLFGFTEQTVVIDEWSRAERVLISVDGVENWFDLVTGRLSPP